jgi:hypothetical protein
MPPEETKPVGPKRTVKARARMQNIGPAKPNGEPDDDYPKGKSWIVEENDMVPVDHPAVALHPTLFEGV